jgi:Tol biopolymer transport system component
MRHRIPSALQITATIVLFSALTMPAAPPARAQVSNALQPSDYQKLRSVGQAEISPDGKLVAYTIVRFDRPGRPCGQLWVMDLATKKSVRMGAENEGSGGPVWSPDGKWIAYFGTAEAKEGLVIAHPDGTAATFLAEVSDTNAPLPSTGATVTWSPDGKQIAFVSATPGPETADASGDPIVISRYMYKPDAGEGLTHFNDNRRLHIFIVDLATKQIRQLTKGDAYEHSIDWSPKGDEILFLSDPSPNADQFFNYDVFAVKVSDGSIRRITATENAEYHPRWSPDGKMIAFLATKRGSPTAKPPWKILTCG